MVYPKPLKRQSRYIFDADVFRDAVATAYPLLMQSGEIRAELDEALGYLKSGQHETCAFSPEQAISQGLVKAGIPAEPDKYLKALVPEGKIHRNKCLTLQKAGIFVKSSKIIDWISQYYYDDGGLQVSDMCCLSSFDSIRRYLAEQFSGRRDNLIRTYQRIETVVRRREKQDQAHQAELAGEAEPIPGGTPAEKPKQLTLF